MLSRQKQYWIHPQIQRLSVKIPPAVSTDRGKPTLVHAESEGADKYGKENKADSHFLIPNVLKGNGKQTEMVQAEGRPKEGKKQN